MSGKVSSTLMWMEKIAQWIEDRSERLQIEAEAKKKKGYANKRKWGKK